MAEPVLTTVAVFRGLVESVKALGSLQSEQAVNALRTTLNGQVIDVQQAVLELQADLAARQERVAACQQRIAELEEENRRLRDWEGERDRYELKALTENAFAYVAKETGAQGDEPTPNLCAHCFENGQRSILQRTSNVGYSPVMTCPRCQNQLLGPDLL